MKIQVLDQMTIDKIAAGEVIERPSSIVKELVENAIDAKASAITIEIKEGGISFIRISDNGCGIEAEDVRNAFLRHSTSKIRSADDLSSIHSLGFRGEALSSIAAVSRVEMITKTKEALLGTVYCINGGVEQSMNETGASDGTTFMIRQLFYNTPARRKFLKTPMTEASHIGELLTRLAMSHPEISFQFINNGQTKIHTSGNGNLKDVIYHIYGREIAMHVYPIDYCGENVKITGFCGEPVVSRGNRNYETYYINGRYVKSNIIAKAIEDAYKDFTMQHRYPFTVLHLEIDTQSVDVNVHPTKMELRFSNQQELYRQVLEAVSLTLHKKESIPQMEIPEPSKKSEEPLQKNEPLKKEEPKVSFSSTVPGKEEQNLDYFMEKMKQRVHSYHERNSSAEVKNRQGVFQPEKQMDRIKEAANYRKHMEQTRQVEKSKPVELPKEEAVPQQMTMFDDKLLDASSIPSHKVIGQVFDTYWLVEFQDQLYIIDQHAAHERVLYEKIRESMKHRDYTTQLISPPIVLTLSMKEKLLLETYMEQFQKIGFEIEPFGTDAYAICGIPDNLFGIGKKELFQDLLDQLSEEIVSSMTPERIDDKIASLSCKAAVKGNMKLSVSEIHTLIKDLLTLENPYHCPHGRPTIIAMTKRELEKKFKRVL